MKTNYTVMGADEWCIIGKDDNIVSDGNNIFLCRDYNDASLLLSAIQKYVIEKD